MVFFTDRHDKGVTDEELRAVIKLCYVFELPGFKKQFLKAVKRERGVERQQKLKKNIQDILKGFQEALDNANPNIEGIGAEYFTVAEPLAILHHKLKYMACALSSYDNVLFPEDDRDVIIGLSNRMSELLAEAINASVAHVTFEPSVRKLP